MTQQDRASDLPGIPKQGKSLDLLECCSRTEPQIFRTSAAGQSLRSSRNDAAGQSLRSSRITAQQDRASDLPGTAQQGKAYYLDPNYKPAARLPTNGF